MTEDIINILFEGVIIRYGVANYLINVTICTEEQLHLLRPHVPLDVTANISSLLLIHEIKMYTRNKMIGNSNSEDTHDSLG